MKDIPTDELADISPEIHGAAVRVGCIHVSVTGKIWPGAQPQGAPEDAARFVEFSWLRAAAINGRAVFEQDDPKAYHEFLVRYGLEDLPYTEPGAGAKVASAEVAVVPPPASSAPPAEERIELSVTIKPKTRREIEAQAAEAGLSIGAFLDVRFNPGSGA